MLFCSTSKSKFSIFLTLHRPHYAKIRAHLKTLYIVLRMLSFDAMQAVDSPGTPDPWVRPVRPGPSLTT